MATKTFSEEEKVFADSLIEQDEKLVFGLFCKIRKSEISPVAAFTELQRLVAD